MSLSLLEFLESVWPAATARGRGRVGSFGAVVCRRAAKSVCQATYSEPFLLALMEQLSNMTYCTCSFARAQMLCAFYKAGMQWNTFFIFLKHQLRRTKSCSTRLC